MDKDVIAYINKQASLQKEVLGRIRENIRRAFPLATERMSYGVPSFKFNGQSVLYAGFKNHIGIYPGPEIIVRFKDELKNYEKAKGTVRFDLDKPVPYGLIDKVVRAKFLSGAKME